MTRALCTSTSRGAYAAVAYDLSREELEGLVEYYPEQGGGQSTPRISFQTNMELVDQKFSASGDAETKNTVARLLRFLDDPQSPHELIMDTYYELPSPGAQHLSSNVLRKLRNRLADVTNRDEVSKTRYLNVIADCLASSKAIPLSAWTTAISFAGHSKKRISNIEIDTALSLWKQMESGPSTKANEVTFNTLFSAAAKAGKFVLADMILREMQARGHRMSRFFRVSLIYYHGIRRDGKAVRRAYKELVDADEVVDTVVITCVIEALLKAGEAYAADQTFERSKRLHVQKSGLPLPLVLPPSDQRPNRYLGSSSKRVADIEVIKPSPPSSSPSSPSDSPDLAPTIRTYRALIYHYAVTAGNIDRVAALVTELEAIPLPLYGIIFHHIFKGFARHAGLLYTSWTQDRLEGAFAAFVEAVKTSDGRVYMSKAMCELCLGAFVKAAGVERTKEVWDVLRDLWKGAEEDELRGVEARLEAFIRKAEDGDVEHDHRAGESARSRHFYLR